ncbi:MAG: hypothetical protein ACLFPS_02190 [Clostridia bacterium]
MRKVSAVIFEGGNPQTQIEKDMVILRKAMVLDNLAKFKMAEEIDKIIIATNYPKFRDELLNDKDIIVDFDQGEFNLGKRLSEIIDKYNLEAVFYLGGAAGPLITVEEINQFCIEVKNTPEIVMTNNVQSSDMIVFAPADAINRIHVFPVKDNPLGNLLRDAGLKKVLMPHSTGIHFDIDTPTDMLVLSLNPSIGPNVKQAFKELNYNADHLIRAKHYLALPYADVILSGRVGSPVITHVNTMVRCRLRVYSEERGMKYLKREENELVKSLIAKMIDIMGMNEFFNYMSKIAHVMFFDSRIVYAHNNLHLIENDRFYADLLLPEKVKDPYAKKLTEEIMKAKIPVVPGGHSLVAGGMWSLIETLQHEQELTYSDNKLYDMVVSEKYIYKDLSQLRKNLTSSATIYGLTKVGEGVEPNFTYINPSDDLIIKEGWKIHIAAPIAQIKDMEEKGFKIVKRGSK